MGGFSGHFLGRFVVQIHQDAAGVGSARWEGHTLKSVRIELKFRFFLRIEVILMNITWEISGFKDKILRKLSLKCEVEHTDGPVFVTADVVDDVLLLMNFIIVHFIRHD